jgi:antitoxin component YwqK of YwqJK toxin-antitoxin module
MDNDNVERIETGGWAKGYFVNGQLKYHANLLNDNFHGDYIHFWDNGMPRLKTTYNKGKEDGVSISWSRRGLLDSITKLDNGRENYKEYYDFHGHLLSKSYYLEGELKKKEHYENGKIERADYYDGGDERIHIIKTDYYNENGDILVNETGELENG